MDSAKVRGDLPVLTKTLAMRVVSQSVRRVLLRYDGSEDDLGYELACDGSTVNNAINQKNLMSLHSFFNLLRVDPFAVDSLLNHFNRRSVPITARCDTDELVPLTRAVSKIAEAKADGVMTDRECLTIEPEIDAAIEALLTVKNRCEQIRRAA